MHYAIENNLYFALVDIVDSLWEQYPQMMNFHIPLKDALYRVCKRYEDDVLELLCQYGFPNVSKTCLQEFARKISEIINDADIRDDFYNESLRQMLKSTTEMPFIVDNEPFLLQEGYDRIYLQRMAAFRDSTLIFDEEPKIIEALDRVTITSNTSNYSFVDSTTERFVQISDCIIAEYKSSKFYHEQKVKDLLRTDYNNEMLFTEAVECTPNDTKSRRAIWDENPKIVLPGNTINPDIPVVRTITTKQDRNPNSGNLYFDSKTAGKSKFRYLTPRECFLFMGFTDEDYEHVIENNPSPRKGDVLFPRDKLIRMAGNSIPVKLLEGVFLQILKIDDIIQKNILRGM